MARPIKNGMDYFPHDTDASSDEKLEALRSLYKNDGYAFYFILLERIYRSENGELSIENEAVFKLLLRRIGVSHTKFTKMLQTSFELNLFNKEKFENEKVITSNGIKRRASSIETERERKRKQYKSKKNTGEMEEISEVSPGVFPGETSGETPQSKEKQSKAKIDDDDNAREEKFNFVKFFVSKNPIHLNQYWQDTLIELEEKYSEKWLKEATSRYFLGNGKSANFLVTTLRNWEKVGGEEPWNVSSAKNNGKARGTAGNSRHTPTLEDWKAERERIERAKKGSSDTG